MKEIYDAYKNLLFALAYQMMGSAADAEDVVQDVFMKWYQLENKPTAEPRAYLCKMVTHRCLDMLKSARRKREQYVGPWLPEPIRTEDDIEMEVVRNDLLSYAMLVMLERLSPAERAVFVLREALCFEYMQIASLLDKSEAACRKTLSRAKLKMGITEQEPVHRAKEKDSLWVRQFIEALQRGETETVLHLLDEEVTLISDGGGKAAAAMHPIHSKDMVARFLLGLIRQIPKYEEGIRFEYASLNGQIGVIIYSGETVINAVTIGVKKGLIHELFFVRNPDKLIRL